jgi:hypothetical protein
MYRQLTTAMPSGHRATIPARPGTFPRVMTVCCHHGTRRDATGQARGCQVPVSQTLLIRALHGAGLRSSHVQAASLGAVGLCIGLWIRAKTVDQDERGNAERRALFVGLWPPTLWLISDSLGEPK